MILLFRAEHNSYHHKGGETMNNNSSLAKELSEYPLTAIVTGLLNFEHLNNHFNKPTEENATSESTISKNQCSQTFK